MTGGSADRVRWGDWGGTYLITVHNDRQRERKVIKGTKKDAKQLIQFILRQELAGVNVIAALQGAQSQPEAAPTRP